MSKPPLSVIVCVHNARDYTDICLTSVLRHTPAPYELVVVDDGSDAATQQLLKDYAAEYSHIRLIRHDKAKGYTGAANAGLHATSGEVVILLNSDTIVSPEWNTRLSDCLNSADNIGICGPLSNAATYQSVPHVFDARGHWMQNELPEGVNVASFARAVAKVSARSYPRVPVANGFCFALRREVIDRIGYLDEKTFPRGYGEENDYCLRAGDAGFEIAIADDVYVYHATSKSFGAAQREALTHQAHLAIRSKYSQARLDAVDTALRQHKGMDSVRQRILQRVYQHVQSSTANAEHLPSLADNALHQSILFLLPGCSAKAGGSQQVVELARGLSAMGMNIRIALHPAQQAEFEQFFPLDAHLMLYYERDKDLLRESKRFDICVATIFHTMRQLQAIISAHPHITPLYFVQDYEPYFLEHQPKWHSLALASYTALPSATLFAISPWVISQVKEKHQVPVEKIHGSIDQSIFFPRFTPRAASPLIISAMIRPSTPWRAPERTLNVLKKLAAEHGSAIEIRTFGCREQEIFHENLDADFVHLHYGVLDRHQVAAMLQSSDIFLDLSDFQAFGRTALEAMACGTCVVAPLAGGVTDFGQDNRNIHLCDTKSEDACLSAIEPLISDATLRKRLSTAAIETSLHYSIHRCALSFMQMLSQIRQPQRATKGKKRVA